MQKEIRRGCGKRVAGGIYITTEVGREGIPVNAFLFDPPWVPVDGKGLVHYPGRVGLHMVENPWEDGVVDIWDWIGATYYPYFPDFWEEFCRYGLSRRISISADFDLLSTDSQIIGFHPMGILQGTEELYTDLDTEHVYGTGMDLCPHNKEHDTPENRFCIRYLWQLIGTLSEDGERLHERQMPQGGEPQFTYDVAYAPWWISRKKYKADWIPAAMFHLPIHGIEVIHDPVSGLHEQAVEKLEQSVTNLPFTIVKE
jgi:hypothetical protein